MDARAIAASASASTTTPTTTTTAATTSRKSFAALFAEAEKTLGKGEKLTKVAGHAYAQITGGTRDKQYVNLSGNARSGQAFELITRNGHVFHAYGTGKDRVVIGMGAAPKDANGGVRVTS
jgi:hypothetical protein